MPKLPRHSVNVRLPAELYEKLLECVEGSPSGTISAEVIERLEKSFVRRPDPAKLQARYDAAIADMRQKFDNAVDGWMQTIRELQAHNKELTQRLIAALEGKGK